MDIPISVTSDFICPWCYIGEKRLARAIGLLPTEIDVQLQWLPFELNPDMPPEGMERRAYLARKFGSSEHGQAIQARTVLAGRDDGATFDYEAIKRTPNTFLAHRASYLAQREGSPASFGLACYVQVQTSYNRGDLVVAEEHFARWSGFLDAKLFRHAPGAAVTAMSVASFCAWALGHANSARQRIVQGIAFAGDSKNPYDLAVGRFFESWLYCWLREPQHPEVAATQALALAEEHGFAFNGDVTRAVLGWAQAQLGNSSEGVALIRQGLAGMTEAGARLAITDLLGRLAEAQALDGKIDNALVTIEEALQADPEALVYRPNAKVCRGELRLKAGQTALAETDFREAIMLAQKMQAKSFELRATTSLSRLLASQGRRDEARTMLREVYNWFTEGFDTADLKEAKAQLDQLSDAGAAAL